MIGVVINARMEEEFSEVNENQQKISKYNSGVAQIYRIDELWKDTHRHSRKGMLVEWNFDLDRVWIELVGDLKDKDKRFDDYESFTLQIGDLNNKLVDKKIEVVEYRRQMYSLLMDKETFLRRLLNELGKGTKYLEGDEDYLDG